MASKKRHIEQKGTITDDFGNILETPDIKSKYYGFGVFLAYTILYEEKIYLNYKNEDFSKTLNFSLLYKSQNNITIYPSYLPPKDKFNWWVWLGDISFCGDRIYSIIEFENVDTVFGFVDTMEKNQIDFRNVTSWAPYTTDKNKNIIPLAISGYDLDYYNPSLPIQYTIIPYSS